MVVSTDYSRIVPPTPVQEFAFTMRQLTDGVHWRGIGGPDDTSNIERSSFAKALRDAVDQLLDRGFERLQGGAAAARGKGASGWHLYNCTIPSLVEQPTPHIDELGDGSTSTQE